MITVFHNKKFLECSFLSPKLIKEKLGNQPNSDFEKVAIIYTNDLEEAFEKTNHISQTWYNNPDVTTLKESRSSSIGDILEVNGKFFGVSSTGFIKITNFGKIANKNKI